MSADRPPPAPEPSADAIEALVRAIDARESGAPGASQAGRRPPDAGTTRPAASEPVDRDDGSGLVLQESLRHRRYGGPCAIVLFDLAPLDEAPVRLDPDAVRRLARPTGATLASIARASDWVGRLADGRFGILLREADASGARRVAARATAACDPWLAVRPDPLRLVAGWASPEGGEDLVGALRRAERRLQEAVARGNGDG